MSSDKLADAQRIYDEWHAGFTTGDMARVAALYAEDAVFESPAVFGQFPDAEEGILMGRDKVRELFEFNLNNLSGASATCTATRSSTPTGSTSHGNTRASHRRVNRSTSSNRSTSRMA